MITEATIMGELSEPTAIPLNISSINATDEIKRNHLQSQEITKFPEAEKSTELATKFIRLKKALRRRSSNIF